VERYEISNAKKGILVHWFWWLRLAAYISIRDDETGYLVMKRQVLPFSTTHT